MVIATPGRLIELLTRHSDVLPIFDSLCTLVIDEVDSMLSKGFKDQVRLADEALEFYIASQVTLQVLMNTYVYD